MSYKNYKQRQISTVVMVIRINDFGQSGVMLDQTSDINFKKDYRQ